MPHQQTRSPSESENTPIPSKETMDRFYARSRNDSMIGSGATESSRLSNGNPQSSQRSDLPPIPSRLKKPVIRVSDQYEITSPVSPERSATAASSSYYSTQDDMLRVGDGDDRAIHTPPPSMGGLEFVGGTSPSEVEDSSLPSDLSAVTVRSDRTQGLETFRAALDVFEGIKASVLSVEDSAMMIRHLEKKADRSVKRTYMMGQPMREIDEKAPVLKVGLSFLQGCDRPTVNRVEQADMIPNKRPDQLTALWRVNTAGHLLNDFVVSDDLSYVRIDRTKDIASRARDRLGRQQFMSPFTQPTPNSYPLVIRNREFDAVTIDSEQVEIVNDLRSHNGEFDVESTLVEVDGPSLLRLIVGYKDLIQRRDPASNLDETKTLLEIMMESVRRLCHRSPILFRMSTRNKIISSRNTRYGTNHGIEFTTLTTSKGIREIISLSAAYYSTLDADQKAQSFIRPRYLQMLVLLLSFLNDDDLQEIKPFLESTFRLQADRKHLELLFLKVIPLASINDKLFLTSMIPAIEGWRPNEPIKPEKDCWDTFISRLLPMGYLLPGTVLRLGRNPMSWIMTWPNEGFKNSSVFHNLQYEGALRTFNDVPPIEDLIDREDDNTELTVEMTNGVKYLIGVPDYEPIVCLTEGLYSVQPVQPDARRVDLIIKEERLNNATREAIRIINPIIRRVNQWFTAPKRTNSRFGRLRSRRQVSDILILDEVQISGRITKHMAILGQDVLATAYKLDGRKLFIRDAIGIMAHDILSVDSIVRHYETHMRERIDGLDTDTYRELKGQLGMVSALIKQAESSRLQLSEQAVISDEPIAKVIQPRGGSPYAARIWHEYRTYLTAGNYLQMEAMRSIVAKVTWLSNVLVEILLNNDSKKYFAQSLEFVEDARRQDEIREGDIAVLAGQYIIIAEPNDADTGDDAMILTNYLRVTSVEEPVVSTRGANRRHGRNGPNNCLFV